MIKKKTLQTLQKKPKGKALSKPDVFREFVVWMSIPVPLRKPKTQEEFRKKCKVSRMTLASWKQRDDFWEAVESEWNKWGREKTSNIMLKFYKDILEEKNPSFYKLWFQYFLKWNEKAPFAYMFIKV